MKRSKPFFSIWPVLGLCLLFSSCSESPINTVDPDDPQATGQVDPSGPSTFLLGTVTAGPNSGQVEVWASNLTIESDELVSFDAVIVNKSRWPINAPIHFVITDIRPDFIEVANPDFIGSDGPVFDFSDDLGSDEVLDPGESSEPVNMKFQWPEPMAFAIGFRIDAGGDAATGFVSGIVFSDLNGDGQFDMNNEPGIPGIVVKLVPSGREILYRTRTDNRGRYVFDGLTADVYTIKADGVGDMQPTTPNPLIVPLVELPDGTVTGFDDAYFGFLGAPLPPQGLIFGPVPVGPASRFGTEFVSTFVVPDFFAAVDLFLKVVPPPMPGAFRLRIDIDEASVAINDVTIWEFTCEAPDSVCMPATKVLLDPALQGANTIRIKVLGDPRSFLLFSIDAETTMPE